MIPRKLNYIQNSNLIGINYIIYSEKVKKEVRIMVDDSNIVGGKRKRGIGGIFDQVDDELLFFFLLLVVLFNNGCWFKGGDDSLLFFFLLLVILFTNGWCF